MALSVATTDGAPLISFQDGVAVMRRLLTSMMVTLDGLFAGPNEELDWHNVDAEFNEYADELLSSVDALVFGRVTYQMMASYWPTPYATETDPIIAAKMNAAPKVVFSHTLETVEWNNARLVNGELVEEVARLKQEPGKDMVIFGSGSLVSALTQHHLIDEYRIIVNPVVLGEGRPLFEGLSDRVQLQLLRTQTFRSGNVLLAYQPVRQEGE